MDKTDEPRQEPRLCCYILDQAKLNESCQRPAVYQIWFGYEPGPEDYTESCEKHLAQLLGDNMRFEILRILVEDDPRDFAHLASLADREEYRWHRKRTTKQREEDR